jgi:hypothetical protein
MTPLLFPCIIIFFSISGSSYLLFKALAANLIFSTQI